MTFGLLDTGFNPKRQTDVEDAIDAAIDAGASLGPNLDTEAESPLGQIKIIVANAVSEIWATMEQINAGLLQASGVQLDNLVQIFRITRNPAIASTDVILLTGTPTTLIPAGSQVKQSDTNQLWSLTVDATIGGGGTINGAFTALDTGPIKALAGTTFVIATPVSGWSAAGPTALDAVVGRITETDGKLRARALEILTASGGTSSDDLRAAILHLSGVTETLIVDNDSPYVDADGRPPHSFEAVVRGGDDQAIADAIWAHKPAGIESDTTVLAPFQQNKTIVDANGDSQALSYSRPEEVDVWIEVDYTPTGSFPTGVTSVFQIATSTFLNSGEAAMLQALLDLGSALRIGDGLTGFDLDHALFCAFDDAKSVFSGLALRMGLSASPPNLTNVPTARTTLAILDSTRILITRV